MSLVNITNVKINNNPAPFQSPIVLDITFECLKALEAEIDWKLIYIGSPKDEKLDQVLDSFSMGPLQEGVMQFTLESVHPDHTKIPQKGDLLGITAIILSASYKSQEFFRVGYYVYNNYTSEENIQNEPQEVIISDVERAILADKPRITRFQINWTGEEQTEQIQADNQAFMFADEDHKQPDQNEKPNENSMSQFAINSVFQN